MTANISITLVDQYAEFIDAQIASGRFANSDDVVRAGLRPLKDYEAKLETLRAAIDEVDASGEALPFDREAFFKRMRQRSSIGDG